MSTQTMSGEWEDELESMAEARVEIEEELTERQDELAQIGTFDTARCTSFDRKYMHRRILGRQLDDPDHPQAETKVSFEFTFPDGTTSTRSFNIEDEPRTIQSFLDTHGADSVTDMIGADHACQYTKSGWELCDKRTVRPWVYQQFVGESGDLTQFHRGWIVAILSSLSPPVFALLLGYPGTAMFLAFIFIPLFFAFSMFWHIETFA